MGETHVTAIAMQEESMELHIEGQRIEVSDDLRTMIADRLEKLNAHHGEVTHARVSLVKSNHHQHGSDEARIILSMTRRKVLQAAKVGKTIEEAINTPFDLFRIELLHFGADESVHFTRQVVMGGAFERLIEGMSVEVDVMEGSEGYEATRVVPLQ